MWWFWLWLLFDAPGCQISKMPIWFIKSVRKLLMSLQLEGAHLLDHSLNNMVDADVSNGLWFDSDDAWTYASLFAHKIKLLSNLLKASAVPACIKNRIVQQINLLPQTKCGQKQGAVPYSDCWELNGTTIQTIVLVSVARNHKCACEGNKYASTVNPCDGFWLCIL